MTKIKKQNDREGALSAVSKLGEIIKFDRDQSKARLHNTLIAIIQLRIMENFHKYTVI